MTRISDDDLQQVRATIKPDSREAALVDELLELRAQISVATPMVKRAVEFASRALRTNVLRTPSPWTIDALDPRYIRGPGGRHTIASCNLHPNDAEFIVFASEQLPKAAASILNLGLVLGVDQSAASLCGVCGAPEDNHHQRHPFQPVAPGGKHG